MRILALDIGSSAVKAAYFNGRRFSANARAAFPTEFHGTAVQAPADRILKAMHQAAREVLRGQPPIDIISFCAFSCGVVVTDHRGKVRLGAITHQDRRSLAESRELVCALGKILAASTHWQPSVSRLDRLIHLPPWIHRHAPAVLRGDYRLGQLSSLIALALTNQWSVDPSQATFLGLYDIRSQTWSRRICRTAGISIDSLPKIQWADSIIGTLTHEIASAWNSRSVRAGTPVVGGFVDTDAAVIQTPMTPGQLVHNSGSTDVLALCLEKPRPHEGILTRPVGVGEKFPKRWLAVQTIAAAGSALNWARQTLFPGISDTAWQMTLARIKPVLSAALPDCIPSFSGERASIEQPPGAAFYGVTLSTTPQEILAAIIRGLVAKSLRHYASLQAIQPPAHTVYSMGRATSLAKSMHAAWPHKHQFQTLPADSLPGLVKLAQKCLNTKPVETRSLT